MSDQITYIYFILSEETSSIKIGVARDIQKRLSSLQTGSPFTLTLLDKIECIDRQEAYLLESKLHRYYKKHWLRGEWFSSEIDISNIKILAKELLSELPNSSKSEPMLTNAQIIDYLIQNSDVENPNQFASYLTEKYGVNISRQQINQFQKSSRITITQLLLREAIEHA